MKIGRLLKHIVGVALLLLSGCEVAQNAPGDFRKATDAISATLAKPAPPPALVKKGDSKVGAGTNIQDSPKPETPKQELSRDVAAATPVRLVGKSEGEIRSLFGPPTSEEDRAPGKTWHYRDGQCAVDIQLYPDVQTRKFGTLAYEVKSHDSTDEGKRFCLAQLQSRSRASRE